MKETFEQAMKNRRTVYAIGRGSLIKEKDILAVLKTATDYAPSAFNSQSQRAVLLTGSAHDKLWAIVLAALKKVTPDAAFQKTESKIAGFAAGEGTILFFDDSETTDGLKKAFPLYEANFDPWAEQSNGMLQYLVWTSLESLGLGVNLQHYNPLIDEEVKATWKLPASWRLRGEMVYGKKLAEPDPRAHLDVEKRVLCFDK